MGKKHLVYLEYCEAELYLWIAYRDLQNVLNEEAVIFQRTQPKSPVLDGERVDGGKFENKDDAYVMDMEQKHIKERVDEAQKLYDTRKKMLEDKEIELKESKEVEDQIYIRWIHGEKVSQIAKELYYCETHIYRYLKRMRKSIDMLVNVKNFLLK